MRQAQTNQAYLLSILFLSSALPAGAHTGSSMAAADHLSAHVLEAGVIFAKTEGFISAPETNHAIAGVIEEAKKAKDEAKEKVILFNWSGHGLIDLGAYDKYFAGELFNFVLTEEEILASEKAFEDFPKPQLIKSR